MSDQSDFEFASQFVASNEIDQTGKDILKLLDKAAADRRHALETAQRLSHQLQNAENRIAELEAEGRKTSVTLQLGTKFGKAILCRFVLSPASSKASLDAT